MNKEFICANLDYLRRNPDEVPTDLSLAKQRIYLDLLEIQPLDHINSRTELQYTSDLTHQGFIESARQEAMQSTCWADQVGTVVVDQDKIIARGHNGPVVPGIFCQVLTRDPNEVRELLAPGEALYFCQGIHDVAVIIGRSASFGPTLISKKWYLSLEPCDNCANLLVVTRPEAVYFAEGERRRSYYNSRGVERLLMARIPTFYVTLDD